MGSILLTLINQYFLEAAYFNTEIVAMGGDKTEEKSVSVDEEKDKKAKKEKKDKPKKDKKNKDENCTDLGQLNAKLEKINTKIEDLLVRKANIVKLIEQAQNKPGADADTKAHAA